MTGDDGHAAWKRDYTARTRAEWAALCAAGSHDYRRAGDEWACRHCPAVAPVRPAVREAS